MFQNVIKLACGWNRMKNVFKSLQKCIISKDKKQKQFEKLNPKLLSERQMTGIEPGKVLEKLQKYIIRIAKDQG